ncbi:MAG: hypothetical protein HJJLKODD_01986 [Phycisphaerae bacterium]|nr:hypothetical protein [Phycisphaerae bacterium]
MSSLSSIGSLLPSILVTPGQKSAGGNSLLSTLATPGAKATDVVNLSSSIGNAFLAGQAQLANQPVQIYSQKQADQYNQMVQDVLDEMNSGDLAGAKEKTQALLKRDYRDATAHHLSARLADVEGDHQGALAHYEAAAQNDPGNTRFQEDLDNARILLRSDAQVLNTGLQLVRDRNEALRGIRLLLSLADRTDGSKSDIYQSIAKGFNTLDLPVQEMGALGEIVDDPEATTEDLQTLESAMQEFINNNEPVGLAYSILGRTQQRLGKFQEALQSLEKASDIVQAAGLTENPYITEEANIYASYGQQKLAEGQYTTAVQYFEEAKALDPTNEDIKFGLAAVKVQLAKDYINKGLDLKARSMLGQATALLGDDESLDKEIGQAYYRLGLRARAKGMDETATLDFERAYDRDPKISGLKQDLADLYVGSANEILSTVGDISELDKGDFEDLVDYYQKAFDLFSTRSDYRQQLGWALDEYGQKLMNTYEKYGEAVDVLKRATELYPDNPDYQAHYQQALQLHLDNPDQ